MPSETSATLLERLRDGAEPLAWQEFTDRYWRLIFSFAKRRGCSDQTAEDIVQDVLLEVYQERAVFQYDPRRGRFRDWLGILVRNLIAQHRRRPAQRIRVLGRGTGEEVVEHADTHARPDEIWDAAYEQALLAVLLDIVRREVAPETFQAFELVVLQGRSGEQAAELTGLTRNAVYLSRKRVLRRLQELGASFGGAGELHQLVKQTLANRPAAEIERSVLARLEQTMRSQQGQAGP